MKLPENVEKYYLVQCVLSGIVREILNKKRTIRTFGPYVLLKNARNKATVLRQTRVRFVKKREEIYIRAVPVNVKTSKGHGPYFSGVKIVEVNNLTGVRKTLNQKSKTGYE